MRARRDGRTLKETERGDRVGRRDRKNMNEKRGRGLGETGKT